MTAIHGTCLCGGVKFKITGPLLRPLQLPLLAVPQAARRGISRPARVSRNDFHWLQGWSAYYEATPGYRAASATSRSPILSRAGHSRLAIAHPPTLSEFGIALATLNGDRACSRRAISLSAARHRGSKSPTICRNTKIPAGRLESRQVGVGERAVMDVQPAQFGAAVQLGKDLAGVEQPVGVEGAFEALLLGEVGRVEHRPHQVALLDADTVLAGQHAADFDAEPQDVGAEFLGALDLAGRVGVVEDQRVEIAVAMEALATLLAGRVVIG